MAENAEKMAENAKNMAENMAENVEKMADNAEKWLKMPKNGWKCRTHLTSPYSTQHRLGAHHRCYMGRLWHNVAMPTSKLPTVKMSKNYLKCRINLIHPDSPTGIRCPPQVFGDSQIVLS
jgi:hypothetical protein